MTSANISYRNELLRKGIHLTSILIPLVAWHLDRFTTVTILLFMLNCSLAFDILRFRRGRLGDAFRALIHPIARLHEARGRFSYRRLTGSSWMLAAGVITFLIFPKPIAVAAFAMLILCDTAAALVGRKFGSIRFGPKQKSLEGSAAFFVTGVIIVTFIPGLPLVAGIAGAAAATLAEALLPEMDDNATIPIVACTVMWLLGG